MTETFISVGSNIAPDTHVPAALRALMRHVTVCGISTMYRTEPLGRPEQASFVNGIWSAVTDRDARSLKYDVLRGIETALGRVRTADAYAARTIDLDIVVFGDAVLDEDGLVIPDPDILERPFLAIPLLELKPDLRLPGSGVVLAQHPVCMQTGAMTALPELTKQLKEIANL